MNEPALKGLGNSKIKISVHQKNQNGSEEDNSMKRTIPGQEETLTELISAKGSPRIYYVQIRARFMRQTTQITK